MVTIRLKPNTEEERMTNKISKAVIIFSVGVTISLASIAFFERFMGMPQQAMMMGSMVMQPQPCNCPCKKN
jgi:hypothetical protein